MGNSAGWHCRVTFGVAVFLSAGTNFTLGWEGGAWGKTLETGLCCVCFSICALGEICWPVKRNRLQWFHDASTDLTSQTARHGSSWVRKFRITKVGRHHKLGYYNSNVWNSSPLRTGWMFSKKHLWLNAVVHVVYWSFPKWEQVRTCTENTERDYQVSLARTRQNLIIGVLNTQLFVRNGNTLANGFTHITCTNSDF